MTVPRFGFVIDNRKCIGCHACTVACKSENAVPLGVNRTWVKYVEKGVFPDTRRFFQVTRCNHCANPPCVHICPTRAMFQRADGIVEFDHSRCIGCKACMQACPYDAIYMDPESHTAAKCHYCAHRTDLGLEPACVVICPVHAILAGDLNDSGSEIARALATRQVRARKPEQGTNPKLFYIEAEESAIVPGLARQDRGSLWASPPAGEGDWRGPLLAGEGSMAGALMQAAAAPRETYNVPHKAPWHWPVPAYLVTKAIGAGMFLIAAWLLLNREPPPPSALTVVPLFLSLAFIGVTVLLLIADLDQPKRFFYMLIYPQWKSWLTRGAFTLIGFSALGGLTLLAHLLSFEETVQMFAALALPFAVLSAVYTGFLFAQAEGRDLWQSPLLPVHLLVQALMAGAAGFLLLRALMPGMSSSAELFAIAVVLNLALTLGGEFAVPHASQVAASAARMLTHGRYKNSYWFSVLGGLVLPLAMVLLLRDSALVLALAGALSISGLFAYEWAYVMAPQQVPNN